MGKLEISPQVVEFRVFSHRMVNQFKRLFRHRSVGAISEHKVIDFFDEESRQNIYQWSAKRLKKEQKSFWYRMKIYMISWKVISFLTDDNDIF